MSAAGSMWNVGPWALAMAIGDTADPGLEDPQQRQQQQPPWAQDQSVAQQLRGVRPAQTSDTVTPFPSGDVGNPNQESVPGIHWSENQGPLGEQTQPPQEGQDGFPVQPIPPADPNAPAPRAENDPFSQPSRSPEQLMQDMGGRTNAGGQALPPGNDQLGGGGEQGGGNGFYSTGSTSPRVERWPLIYPQNWLNKRPPLLDPGRANQVNQLEQALDNVQQDDKASPQQKEYAKQNIQNKIRDLDPQGLYGRNGLHSQISPAQMAYGQNVHRDAEGNTWALNPRTGEIKLVQSAAKQQQEIEKHQHEMRMADHQNRGEMLKVQQIERQLALDSEKAKAAAEERDRKAREEQTKLAEKLDKQRANDEKEWGNSYNQTRSHLQHAADLQNKQIDARNKTRRENPKWDKDKDPEEAESGVEHEDVLMEMLKSHPHLFQQGRPGANVLATAIQNKGQKIKDTRDLMEKDPISFIRSRGIYMPSIMDSMRPATPPPPMRPINPATAQRAQDIAGGI